MPKDKQAAAFYWKISRSETEIVATLTYDKNNKIDFPGKLWRHSIFSTTDHWTFKVRKFVLNKYGELTVFYGPSSAWKLIFNRMVERIQIGKVISFEGDETEKCKYIIDTCYHAYLEYFFKLVDKDETLPQIDSYLYSEFSSFLMACDYKKYSVSDLKEAVKKSDLVQIKNIVESSPYLSINTALEGHPDKNILIYAIYYREDEIALYLIKTGLFKDSLRRALFYAACFGCIHTLKHIISIADFLHEEKFNNMVVDLLDEVCDVTDPNDAIQILSAIIHPDHFILRDPNGVENKLTLKVALESTPRLKCVIERDQNLYKFYEKNRFISYDKSSVKMIVAFG